MKVIILAGGTGTRLGSITQYIPKPMVRVGGRPLLWHIMKRYAAYGHKDFVVALGYRGDVIKEFFMNYDSHSQDFTINLGNNNVEFHNSSHTRLDWNVTLVDTGDNTLKGSRIKQLESFIEGTTMMTYGDGVSDVNLDELEKFHRSHGKCVTLTGVHPPSRFGEIKLKNNNLIGFEEKPQTSSGLINGGYMVFEPRFLEYLTHDVNCDLEYGALERLAQEGEVMVYQHGGLWACVDHERDLMYLNKLWNEGNAFWL